MSGTSGRTPLGAIEASLPNGFHDALLHAFRIEVEAGELHLVLSPDRSTGSGDHWDPHYRKALLSLSGVKQMQIQAIEFDARDDLRVFLDTGDMSDRAVMEAFNCELKEGQFACWIFLGEMNANVRVIASEVTFKWL